MKQIDEIDELGEDGVIQATEICKWVGFAGVSAFIPHRVGDCTQKKKEKEKKE